MKIARRKLKVEVPSVAMGDIAFNLLVFFVILARTQDDSHLKWSPAVTNRVEETGHSKISIVIDDAGKTFLNGQQLGEAQLESRVAEELGSQPPGQRMVRLKIHSSTEAYRFEPVLEAVSKAGGEIVHILEEKK
jgi:biopolymer transport protein ExbD